MSLIQKIYDATKAGHLIEPFTVGDLRNWIEKMHIVKDNGDKYARSSIDVILSNSDRKNIPTSNLNKKMLKSRLNDGENIEYFF
jgi:hypothetical protein